MALTAGSRLGVYEVGSALGVGGMGEVYRAHDTKLGRAVAIKVLPEALATDADRVSRLEREAKVLAQLNHPHVAALFGMDVAGGRHFLVMELVEGDTLAERLRRGPLPLADVLRIAIQIADAVEAAHEKGIIHRDLKPANVKIGLDDRVKVLDFGLARLGATEAAAAVGGSSDSPTFSIMATQAGVILGTAAYMSPEQAKGFVADHRSDVFSFGVVLYEMLTGRQPFHGETATDVLASVLARDADLSTLNPDLPPRLVELLARCLAKSPRRRWQAMGDVRAELETIAANPRAPSAAVVTSPKPLWKRAIPVTIAALLAIVATSFAAWLLRPLPERPVTRFVYSLPPGQTLPGSARSMLAVSPDGKQLVYASEGRLYARTLAEFEAHAIQGGDLGASSFAGGPIFSPDGRWVAFFASVDRAILLKKIASTGGAPVTICTVESASRNVSLGMSWNGDEILFGTPDGIKSVPAAGGTPSLVIAKTGTEVMLSPQPLPGSDFVLFSVAAASSVDAWDRAQIVAQSRKTGERKTLIAGGSDARYVSTGHLVYALGGTLYAVPFDSSSIAVRGAPEPVVEGVRRGLGVSGIGIAQYAFADAGTLAYIPGPLTTTVSLGARDLILGDRAGNVEKLPLPAGNYSHPRISPDGHRLAVAIDDAKESSIWVYDLRGGSAIRRITFSSKDHYPTWSPDGTQIVFQSDRAGDLGLFVQSADGGTPARLTSAASGDEHIPESWVGDTVMYDVKHGGEYKLWAVGMRDSVAKPFDGVLSDIPTGAALSPDGRWVAYAIGDGNSTTVHVQPVPPTGTQYQISRPTDDAHHPLWSIDGSALSYIPGPGRLLSVTVTTRPVFGTGNPIEIPRRFSINNAPANTRSHDMTPDGRRIVGLAPPSGTEDINRSLASEIRVVVNWFEDLRQRVPTGRR